MNWQISKITRYIVRSCQIQKSCFFFTSWCGCTIGSDIIWTILRASFGRVAHLLTKLAIGLVFSLIVAGLARQSNVLILVGLVTLIPIWWMGWALALVPLRPIAMALLSLLFWGVVAISKIVACLHVVCGEHLLLGSGFQVAEIRLVADELIM